MALHPKYFLGQVFIRKDNGTLLEITDQLQALENLADELAALNGLTASVTELNYLDDATVAGLVASKAVIRSAAVGIPLKTLAVNAAGANQTNGTALTADVNIVAAADNTTCVVLPVAVVGETITIVNTVANKVLPVFPATGASINALGANAAYTMGPGQTCTFHCTASLTWFCNGQSAATPSVAEQSVLTGATAGGLDASLAVVRTAASGIALKTLAVNAAGNSQGTGTALTADVNVVALADGTTGVVLPTAIVGHSVRVVNTVADQVLKVYPATGGQINALGANVAFSLGGGRAATFNATALLTWYVDADAAALPTTAEQNILDGATVTAAELNLNDNQVASATMVVGVEAAIAPNAINVAIQLKDAAGADMATRSVVRAYLAADSAGADLCVTAPTGGVTNGTDGEVIPVTPALSDAIVLDGNLAISATAEKFKTTQTLVYFKNGVSHTKAATDNLTFTAAHTITASKFGCIRLQIDAAGTISTKVVNATQAYDDAPTALAALPAADVDKIAIGYIAIANNAGDWVGNTNNLTDGGDVTTAAFVDATETAVNGSVKAFDLVSEADGDIDVLITDAGTPTFYLAVVLPNGTLNVSGAITFA